jgi:3'-phosphoadenosine 5'-phosphosulfate sulfotransferase (PAPS reductase)/FAD synthetase
MTLQELRERQSWSLEQKIDHSLGVIEQYHTTLNGKVYVAFSGGKDSTVLYWLARRLYPDIKACFCNTRNEYPEIVRFVLDMKHSGYNIDIVFPKYKPHEIAEIFGFPLVSKQTANLVWYKRNRPDTQKALQAIDNDRTAIARVANKWRYLFDVPYEVSDKCCEYMKKKPMHEYDLKMGLSPILGTMACESKIRETAYIHTGHCNTFNNRDKRKQKSRPLSIWTENDVWECIKKYDIPICDIYTKPGGLTRTGCACCGFGAQFADDKRMQYCYDNYPKLYDYFMKFSNNGVEYREALRDMLKVEGLYLPDEKPKDLFDI